MTTEQKVIGIGGLITLIIIVGGIWLTSSQATRDKARLSVPLMGEEIATQGANHVSDGTVVKYNSNPPTSGSHYVNTEPAGIYDKPVPDGNILHSMEHGAVVLWYKSDLSKDQLDQLEKIFIGVEVSKKIMTPIDNLDVPVAMTSWGRLLKLQTINEAKIKEFMVTNYDRAPEKAPI